MVDVKRKYITVQGTVTGKLRRELIRDMELGEFAITTKEGKAVVCTAWRKVAQACKAMVVDGAELLLRGYWDEADIYGSKLIVTGLQKVGGKLSQEEVLAKEWGSYQTAVDRLREARERMVAKGFIPMPVTLESGTYTHYVARSLVVNVEGVYQKKSDWFCDVMGADVINQICKDELGAEVLKLQGENFLVKQKKLWGYLTEMCLEKDSRLVIV